MDLLIDTALFAEVCCRGYTP